MYAPPPPPTPPPSPHLLVLLPALLLGMLLLLLPPILVLLTCTGARTRLLEEGDSYWRLHRPLLDVVRDVSLAVHTRGDVEEDSYHSTHLIRQIEQQGFIDYEGLGGADTGAGTEGERVNEAGKIKEAHAHDSLRLRSGKLPWNHPDFGSPDLPLWVTVE